MLTQFLLIILVYFFISNGKQPNSSLCQLLICCPLTPNSPLLACFVILELDSVNVSLCSVEMPSLEGGCRRKGMLLNLVCGCQQCAHQGCACPGANWLANPARWFPAHQPQLPAIWQEASCPSGFICKLWASSSSSTIFITQLLSHCQPFPHSWGLTALASQ